MNITDEILKEAFTNIDNIINAKLNELTIDCFDSTNDKFSMDCDGNLVVNSLTTKVPITMETNIIDLFYPVGSYYETSNEQFNPNEKWGGLWKLDSEGLVTVSQDSNQIEFSTLGQIGGSKYPQKHYHDVRYNNPENSGVSISYTGDGDRVLNISSWEWAKNFVNEFGGTSNLKTNYFGQGEAGNLQPYLVVKRWHRIA